MDFSKYAAHSDQNLGDANIHIRKDSNSPDDGYGKFSS